MTVLDVGCGPGAITIGIARVVEPGGHVVGIDQDEGLLNHARQQHGTQPNLRFANADITEYSTDTGFDVVTAARTLQWIAKPELAVDKMKQACRPGGTVLVLDYNHEVNTWNPAPPVEFRRFYAAFLAWRSMNGWDNCMADHLPAFFEKAGLQNITVTDQDDIARREDPDFLARTDLWSEVIRKVSTQLTAASYCTPAELQAAYEVYGDWRRSRLQKQTLAMRAVKGDVPTVLR
jgi:SAM-dependent methyltransferase